MAFKSLLERFKKGLARTAKLFNVRSWFGKKVDQEFLDKLEATLIQADVGVKATTRLSTGSARRSPTRRPTRTCSSSSRGSSRRLLADPRPGTLAVSRTKPTVYLIAGVNGSGKTTSIAKLAQRLKNEGKTILLAACDTFRAAAADQLDHLGRALRLRHRQGRPGGRPGQRRPRRLRPGPGPRRGRPDRRHRRPAAHPVAPDARAGEDPPGRRPARSPARPTRSCWCSTPPTARTRSARPRSSPRSIGCTGVILTKLDGTAKGGVVVAVRQAMNLPVKFIGVGEGLDDLQPFDADTFVESLFTR